MLKTLTVTHTISIGGSVFYIHGANSQLAMTQRALGWGLSRTPVRDPCKVWAFSSWLLDNAAKLAMGAGVQLGMLTGEIDSALLILKGGIQGTDGDPHVVLRGPFLSDYGLVTHIPELPITPPAVYYVRTVVIYEPA
ncbi:unnamed protein product [marine sediment metagenome]|uniref:Uncharacterized protein n=1 Tax=marine sediment metagenome TaxID=412755 RepID=X1UE04_9ZZZZ